jgi:hypothetical protein
VADVVRIVIDALKSLLGGAVSGSEQETRRRTRSTTRPTTKKPTARKPTATRTTTTGGRAAGTSHGYAGDATGRIAPKYAPFADDRADPGEIVWAWVPFEEDHSQGKDRPVLVIGRRGDLLLALILTSQDHDREAADEARFGRHWVEIGAGDWDEQGRPSEIRVDRVLQLDPSAVRRRGAVLDKARFDRVAAGVRKYSR